MSKPFNPAYNEIRKNNKDRFTLVTHVPVLPPASASYEYTVLFDRVTNTFCKCVKRDGAWVWDAVTTPYRQFVTSAKVVNRMVGGEVFKFNDLVGAVNVVMHDLERFGLRYDALPPYEEDTELTGANYKEFADCVNKIIADINRISGLNLETIDASTLNGDNLEEARLKLNELIKAVNPHADLLNDIQTVIESGSVVIKGSGNADLVAKTVYKWVNKTVDVEVTDPDTGEVSIVKRHANWDDVACNGDIDNMSIGELRHLMAAMVKSINAVYKEDEEEDPDASGD